MAAISTDNLVRSIYLELGQDRGSGVGVELSKGQIVYAVKQAITEYGRNHPRHSYQSFVAPAGKFEYTPSPMLRGIVDLSMVANTGGIDGIAVPEIPFLGGTYWGFGATIDFQTPFEYQVYQEWRDVAEKAFSSQPAWFFLEEANRLYIYSPGYSVKVSLTGTLDWDNALDDEIYVTPPRDPDDQEPVTVMGTARLDATLALIPRRHVEKWILRLALAKSQQILGEIRSKFSSIPGVDGRDVQINGPELLARGTELWEKMAEDCRLAGYNRVTPIIG